MPRPPSIPRRWRVFAEHLLRDPNAARAARAAGVKDSNAKAWASRTKSRPEFVAYFAERLKEAEHEAQIQTHRVLEELALVAHSSIDDYEVDFDRETIRVRDGVPEEKIRAVAAVKFRRVETRMGDVIVTAEIKLWDKVAAITNAMKHRGILAERMEHSGPDGGAIPHTVTVHFVEPSAAPGATDG